MQVAGRADSPLNQWRIKTALPRPAVTIDQAREAGEPAEGDKGITSLSFQSTGAITPAPPGTD